MINTQGRCGVALACACAVALAGCHSATSATKGNFTKVINTYLAKRSNCIEIQPRRVIFEVSGHRYPFTVSTRALRGNSTDQALTALVSAGLLTEKGGEIKSIRPFSGNKRVPAKVFSLTAVGKKALFDDDRTAFCAGHYVVASIAHFTPPQKEGPVTVSIVKFSYKPVDIPKWATSAAVQAAFPRAANKMKTKAKNHGQALMTLQNDGWTLEDLTLSAP